MKIMNVSLTIDVQNPQQVLALKQLMDALATNEIVNAIAAATAKIVTAPAATPVVEKPKVKRQPKAAAVVEEDMPQACAPEPEPEPEDDLMGEDEPVIDVATLRAFTAEKSILNRAEIKAKLAEYGAANVTSIPKEFYSDYHKFITSL